MYVKKMTCNECSNHACSRDIQCLGMISTPMVRLAKTYSSLTPGINTFAVLTWTTPEVKTDELVQSYIQIGMHGTSVRAETKVNPLNLCIRRFKAKYTTRI